VKVWDAQTGQELLSLKGQAGTVFGVAFSPDGRRIITQSNAPDAITQAWEAHTGTEIVPCLDPPPPSGQRKASSPDGRLLAVIEDGRVVIRRSTENGDDRPPGDVPRR
jgi:WD40 repeat protein